MKLLHACQRFPAGREEGGRGCDEGGVSSFDIFRVKTTRPGNLHSEVGILHRYPNIPLSEQ